MRRSTRTDAPRRFPRCRRNLAAFRRTAAFTLVELVVAVAVAAVAMAVAAAAILGGHSLFVRIAGSVPALDETLARQAAFEALRSDLACALPAAAPSGDVSVEAFHGASDGFSCIRLFPAADGLLEPVGVEWGRFFSGGAVRRVTSAEGTVVREERFPPEWGVPRFSYRALAPCVDASPGEPVPLSAESFDSWPVGDAPLPAVATVRWGTFSAEFPVHCAVLPGGKEEVSGGKEGEANP